MADQDDRPADAGDHVAQVGGVALDAAQRVRHGDDGEPVAVQTLDDAVPAGRFGEGAVDQDDDGLLAHECAFPVLERL
ncbi:hypothetical protein ACFQX6_31685 [Streptosporangium lutulentum]